MFGDGCPEFVDRGGAFVALVICIPGEALFGDGVDVVFTLISCSGVDSRCDFLLAIRERCVHETLLQIVFPADTHSLLRGYPVGNFLLCVARHADICCFTSYPRSKL